MVVFDQRIINQNYSGTHVGMEKHLHFNSQNISIVQKPGIYPPNFSDCRFDEALIENISKANRNLQVNA